MGYLKNIMYNLKGPSQYSNLSHLRYAQKFDPNDLNVSCEGKSYMITGANGAMGRVVTKAIAERGGEVHMVCRNKETAQAVANDVIKTTGNKSIHLHNLDLSESKDVYKFAKEFSQTHSKLDALVYIAGNRYNERSFNSSGVEKTFAINSLAPHILTRQLSPLLQQCIRGRILLMTSSSMLLTKINVDDPQLLKSQKYMMNETFRQTKRQMVVLATQYAQQYPDLFSASVNPGWVTTPFTAHIEVHEKVKAIWRTPEQGADTILWLAISDKILGLGSGDYFQNRETAPKYLKLSFGTRSNQKDEDKFMKYMDEMLAAVTVTSQQSNPT